jgi:hypothetical protein
MAGQHRPVAEPVAAAPAPQQGSRSFPVWPIWMLLVLLVNLGRTCSNHSSDVRLSPEELRQLTQHTPNASPAVPQYPQELEPTVDELNPRLALCDRETRSALLMHLALTRQHDDAGQGLGARPPAAVLNESDPIVAKLLEKCQASRFFDSDGRYQRPPDSSPLIPR